MAFREFASHNFRWKLTALVLALAVWFAIKFAIYKGSNQVLRRLPIMVLKSADDPRAFRVVPPEAEVVVQATHEMRPEDLEVFVNLTSMPDVDTVFKQVLVRDTEGAKIVRIDPVVVMVERLLPSDSSITNSFKKR